MVASGRLVVGAVEEVGGRENAMFVGDFHVPVGRIGCFVGAAEKYKINIVADTLNGCLWKIWCK